MTEAADILKKAWDNGYSVAELWGASKPVSRGDPTLDNSHLILRGILSIVEYQVDRGAGHRYLRDRLWHGDWTAVGVMEPKTATSQPVKLPRIDNIKFGRNQSGIGDGIANYVDVRVLHS